MAKKYYVVKVGKVPGIYFDEWDNVKPLVDGFPGARYKGFKTEAEAKEFFNGAETTASATKKTSSSTNIVSPKTALTNLKKVIVNDSDKKVKLAIDSADVKNTWKETTDLVDGLLAQAYETGIDVNDFSQREDVRALMSSYGMDLEDMSCFAALSKDFDCVAFVDGGGNKVAKTADVVDLGIENEKDDFISTRILFGAVICNLKTNKISLYRFAMERSMEFKNFFRQSNVAGEELAALLAMYISEKEGLSRLAIYQDNDLPANYFAGNYSKVNHFDDAPLQIMINESINYLESGLDINFIYVPSEHACRKAKDKKEKGMKKYEAQEITKLTFDQAEFFNGISDRLADFNI